ncbi:MAG: dihydrodipicolinate synthase family protein [Gemmatimonadaceae bacterium]|jgi:dihydrodipicolinate synthase/N-acetylneuraminate lyase|nr:dihydrodipicolinate synthase family protein [Gemmatimonadaceae bacterium]
MADFRKHLLAGQVIPAHPLALTPTREMDERHQRALTRYYLDAGAGGVAVGVHTTGFPIHDETIGLYRPVLSLAAETIDESLAAAPRPFVRVAGVIGDTRQAVREATIARELRYDCVLLSLGAWRDANDEDILAHCRTVGEVLPLFGFYLQPAVGGRRLERRFWREFAELPSVVAIKIAPFDRYATLDVVRAVADAGRDDIALYTGNDDAIIADLLTDVPCVSGGRTVHRTMVGGLLGQWAVWTQRAVAWLDQIRARRVAGGTDVPRDWLTYGAALTQANAAIFDAAHEFAGCLPGILEVLRRQGLVRGTWTLDAHERLSDGQRGAIDAVLREFPELTDDDFVAAHRDRWLR